MSLKNASCLIFDFDGTLAPNLDLPLMRRQVTAYTRNQGVPVSVYEHLYMVEIIDAAAQWLAGSSPDHADAYHTSAHKLITDFELKAAADTEVFPASRTLLDAIGQACKCTAVVTRNCEEAVRLTFPDIDNYCDLLLARDNVQHLKPDPRHLKQALDQLGQNATQSAMIGDGRMDMHTGKQLGLYCVGVLSGSSDANTLSTAGADLVVDNIDALHAELR